MSNDPAETAKRITEQLRQTIREGRELLGDFKRERKTMEKELENRFGEIIDKELEGIKLGVERVQESLQEKYTNLDDDAVFAIIDRISKPLCDAVIEKVKPQITQLIQELITDEEIVMRVANIQITRMP